MKFKKKLKCDEQITMLLHELVPVHLFFDLPPTDSVFFLGKGRMSGNHCSWKSFSTVILKGFDFPEIFHRCPSHLKDIGC